MKLAHLADPHLGFRQYYRQTPQGINQREADVAGAFRRAVQGVLRARPDAVLIAGDLFHSVRPPNPAILDAFHQLQQLRAGLPDAPIVIVAGNHDTPRTVETGTILRLFEAVPGVRVVPFDRQWLRFERLELSLLCVPHAALLRRDRPALVPPADPLRWKVLLVHGEVAGVIPGDRSAMEYGGASVEPGELHPDRWDYIALGHYHVARRVAPNAWYAGSPEYVSPNPWGELRDEAREGRPGQKGWLLVELGERLRITFQPVALARRVVDLEPIEAAGQTPRQLDAAICERVKAVPGGIDHQIVRQVVRDIPPYTARDLDHARVREFKARALHYHLDLRRPPARRTVGVGAPGTRRTLLEIMVDYLKRRPLDADLDRDRLIVVARQCLECAERDGEGP